MWRGVHLSPTHCSLCICRNHDQRKSSYGGRKRDANGKMSLETKPKRFSLGGNSVEEALSALKQVPAQRPWIGTREYGDGNSGQSAELTVHREPSRILDGHREYLSLVVGGNIPFDSARCTTVAKQMKHTHKKNLKKGVSLVGWMLYCSENGRYPWGWNPFPLTVRRK